MAAEALEKRFTAYDDALDSALAHADRKEPFAAYCRGLILPGQRKSIEPMAARIRPEQVSAAHQSLHHLVAKAAWSDGALLAAVREQVLPALGPVTAWIVDDTATLRRASTRSESPGSTAASEASRTTARSRSRSRSLTSGPACRSPTGSTCPRHGRTIRSDGTRPACRSRSSSRASRRSRSGRSAPRWTKAWHRAWC